MQPDQPPQSEGINDNPPASGPAPGMPEPQTVPAGSVVTPASLAAPAGAPSASSPLASPAPVPAVTPAPPMPDLSGAPAATAGHLAPISGKKGGSRKGLFVALAAVIVIVLGSVGFVFGYHIPNQPENVWKTAMDRTSGQLEALGGKIADPAILDNFTKTKMTLKGSLETDGAKGSLNVDTRYDQEASDSTLKFEASGDMIGQNIALDAHIKTQLLEDSLWPNIYFKISGFKDLGLDMFLPGINEFDDKWIAVEQEVYELLQESLGGLEADESDQSNISHEEMVSIVNDFTEVTREYVFTNDAEKAVFSMKEFIGAEESEGIETNHYKAKINIENTNSYCKALIDKLLDNTAIRRLAKLDDEAASDQKNELKEECDVSDEAAAEDDVLANDEFDVWIDKKYKILHKIRFYENLDKSNERYITQKAECTERSARFDFEDSGSFCDYYDDLIESGERYAEFGQIYRGSDEIRLFMGVKSDTNSNKYTMRADINVDIDTLIFNGEASFQMQEEDNKTSFRLELTTEPHEGEIDAARPEDATSILDVYEYLLNRSNQSYLDGQSLGAQTDEESDVPFIPWLR